MKIMAGASYRMDLLEDKSMRPCWTIKYYGKDQRSGEHALHLTDAAGTNMWFIYDKIKAGFAYYKCVYCQ